MNSREEQFKQIVNEFQDVLYRLCWSYVNTEDDCKDLFQIILVKVWRNLHTFKNRSSLSTWLYRLAVNTSIDYIRTTRRYQNSFSTTDLADIHLIDSTTDSEKNYLHSEKLELLHTCIGRLSFVDKTLVLLYLEELSYKEIAEILGISEKNVSVKLVRIKKLLQSYFKDFET